MSRILPYEKYVAYFKDKNNILNPRKFSKVDKTISIT